MANVELGKKLAGAIKKAAKTGVKKTKLREILEMSGIAVSLGVGIFTLWRAATTDIINEATLQKRIDELKLVDKDIEKKIASVVTQIETATKERQAELQKEKVMQFSIIGGMFVIITILVVFIFSDRKRRKR